MKQKICIKNNDYYGIYKNTTEYQLKLAEIAETKEEIKQYIKLLDAERENIKVGAQDVTNGTIKLVQDYFHKRGKEVQNLAQVFSYLLKLLLKLV